MTSIRRQKTTRAATSLKKLTMALTILAGTSILASGAHAATCAETSVTWTVAGKTCSGNLGEGDSSLTLPYEVASDGGDLGTHGSKVYKCSGSGNWVDTWPNSGGDPANMATCVDNGTLAMKVTQVGVIDPVSLPCLNGYSPPACSFPCDTANDGDTCNAGYCDDSGDITKHFRRFVCDSNSAAPPPPPPSSDCAAETKTWIYNGLLCSGLVPALPHTSLSGIISDSLAPTTGTARFQCDNGTLIEQVGSTCFGPPPPPADCPATSVTWSQGTDNCAGNVGLTASGQTVTVTDSYLMATGSVQMTCNNGVWTSSGPTCTSPAPPVCPPVVTPLPPVTVSAGCYVDTYAWDELGSPSCYSEGCTGTNMVLFSVGDTAGGDYYMFTDPDRFTVVWSGDCTGTGSTCSLTTGTNGIFNATATVTDTVNGDVWTLPVSASKSTVYRADMMTCPNPY